MTRRVQPRSVATQMPRSFHNFERTFDTVGSMTALVFQASLLDCGASVEVGRLGATVRRRELTDGAWIDLRPRWISGADTLFERLHDGVPWHAERRPMYDKVVDVPRLLSFFDEHDPLPDPALVDAKAKLDAHYGGELGERFAT